MEGAGRTTAATRSTHGLAKRAGRAGWLLPLDVHLAFSLAASCQSALTLFSDRASRRGADSPWVPATPTFIRQPLSDPLSFCSPSSPPLVAMPLPSFDVLHSIFDQCRWRKISHDHALDFVYIRERDQCFFQLALLPRLARCVGAALSCDGRAVCLTLRPCFWW